MTHVSLKYGTEAQHLLNDVEFLRKWTALSKRSAGFTTLQEKEYVLTWYELFTDFVPVLCLAENEIGEFDALMCLAWKEEKKLLCHAGFIDAEYGGWLAINDIEKDFLIQSFKLIKSYFPINKWKWDWVSPGLNHHIFKSLSLEKGINVVSEFRSAPVWNLKDTDKLHKFQKSRSLKSKFNRIKKSGVYNYEIITSPERTAEVLSIVSQQCDLRQEAIYGVTPFKSNPQKIKFYSALQNHPGLMHVSAMWKDEQLLAFHLGITDEIRACLGVSSYDPTESKQSPGTLILIEVAKALTNSGYEVFDLTPGTDLYKERFANDYQLLCRPTITFHFREKIISWFKHAALMGTVKALYFLGADRSTILIWKSKIKALYVQLRLMSIQEHASCRMNCLFFRKKIHLYFISQNEFPKPSINLKINQHQYQDLLLYEGDRTTEPRGGFLNNSYVKFNNGETLFSLTVEDHLKWVAWLSEAQRLEFFERYKLVSKNGKKRFVLYDFYFRSDKSERVFDLLLTTINKIDQAKYDELVICTNSPVELSEEQKELLNISNADTFIISRFAGINYCKKII